MKRKSRESSLILCSLVFFCFSVFSSASGTIRNVPAEYPAIQSGIDAADPGDTVLVQPGRYGENLWVNKKAIVLLGVSNESVEIRNTSTSSNAISLLSEGIVVKKMRIYGRIAVLNENSNVSNCIISGVSNIIGLLISNDSQNANISNNIFLQPSYSQYYVCLHVNPGCSAQIVNNTFIGDGSGYALYNNSGHIAIKNNIFTKFYGGLKGLESIEISYNNLFGNNQNFVLFTPLPGTGEVYSDPQLMANFRLHESSPCVGSGENGIDIGAYPFDPSTLSSLRISDHFCNFKEGNVEDESFTGIIIGDIAQKVISLENLSSHDINIDSISSTNSRVFYISNSDQLPYKIESGDKFDMILNFAPDELHDTSSPYGEVLAIHTNDSSSTYIPIYLYGISKEANDTVNVDTSAAKPVFSPLPGNYDSPQLIELNTLTPGASIYYTLDGSEPTVGSLLYQSPINLQETAIIKARAFKLGLYPSEMAIGLYVIGSPRRINVPVDYMTIQAAIDNSNHGDMIIVQPGVYKERLDFKGKSVTVTSLYLDTPDTAYIHNTIIDGESRGRTVTFNSKEFENSILNGFTIMNGSSENGGAIACENGSSPTLKNLAVINNKAGSGAGIFCTNRCNPLLENLIIMDNEARGAGGGIYLAENSSPKINNVCIALNKASIGGGIYCYSGSSPVIINATISDNSVSGKGGAIYGIQNCNIDLQNSILWNNSDNEIYLYTFGGPCSITIAYSDIEGGIDKIEKSSNSSIFLMGGNIAINPRFLSRQYHDYQLSVQSPCIDRGNPDPEDFDSSLKDPNGGDRIFNSGQGRIDMGAYEFQGNVPDNTPPIGEFTFNPQIGLIHSEFQFDASNSFDKEDDIAELTFRWDWENDDNWDTDWVPARTAMEHAFGSVGQYTVSLQVRDSDGLIGSYRQIINVTQNEIRSTIISQLDTILFTEVEPSLSVYFRSDTIKDIQIHIVSYGMMPPSEIETDSRLKNSLGYCLIELIGEAQFYSAIIAFGYSDTALTARDIPEADLVLVYWDSLYLRWREADTILDRDKNIASSITTYFSYWALTSKADILIDGVENYSGDHANIEYGLFQNYPNPFNPSTTIKYSIKSVSYVTLSVFNLLGQKIYTLVDGVQPSGDYSVEWNGVNSSGLPVPSGMYLYRLEAGGFVETKKMLMLK